jgi:hypothetical protein
VTSGFCSPVGGLVGGGKSPMTFTPASPGPPVLSNVRVLWDLDNDGDFTSAEEDITPYVMSCSTIIGRDSPSNLSGKSGPGKLKLTLNNDSNRFSQGNLASPLNAAPFSLKTGRRIRVQTTDGTRGASLITFVGIGTATVADNASIIPGAPAGLLPGDLMLILASIRNTAGRVVTPIGWGVVPDEHGAPMSTEDVTLLGRYYQAGDSMPVVQFTGGVSGATTMAQCFAFRGCRQRLSGLIHSSVLQINASAQNISVGAGNVTITEPNCAVVALGVKQTSWTSAATLAGLTEISDFTTATGGTAAMCIDYAIETTPATFTATSFTITGGVSAVSHAMAFALRPAVDIGDPVLLARDRFDRPDGSILGADEMGHPWVVQLNGGFGVGNGMASVLTGVGGFYGVSVASTLNVGVSDYYVQARLPHIVQDGDVGIIFRFVDSSNFCRAFYSAFARGLYVEEVTAGSSRVVGGPFLIEPWEGMTLGVLVEDNNVTLLLGGTPLRFNSPLQLNRPITGTRVGPYGRWNTWSDLPPELDDFYVWDRVRTDIDGVMGTLTVKSLRTQVAAGQLKTVALEAEGPLSLAANVTVPAPRICRVVGQPEVGNSSVPAGCIVGDIMERAGLLRPPHPLKTNPISHLGPHAVPDSKALDMARHVETAELGFIKETQEGGLAFEDRDYRKGDSSKAWFSDTPGTGQYPYSAIDPLDQQAEIINRAIAGVAATCPTVVGVTSQSDDSSSIDVVITCPPVNPGQLVLVFVVCSSTEAGADFGAPPPWTALRSDLRAEDGNGMRVFALISDGTESGQAFTFYKSSSDGTFVAHIYVIDDWYGTDDGLKLGRFSTGQDAYPISPGWNRAPALYITVQGIIGVTSGSGAGSLLSPPPVGYNYRSLSGLVQISGTSVASLTGIESVYKTDVTDTENPGPWLDVFANWLIMETVCVAVRGYDGPLQKATIENTKATGGQGIFVTVDDNDSQLDHNFISTNPDVPVLLYAESDALAWDRNVLAEHADDRPIIELSFWASKNDAMRTLAKRLRVSDRITVTATGNSGLGIEGDFHIESITHEWSQGVTLWRVTLELSPAV